VPRQQRFTAKVPEHMNDIFFSRKNRDTARVGTPFPDLCILRPLPLHWSPSPLKLNMKTGKLSDLKGFFHPFLEKNISFMCSGTFAMKPATLALPSR